MTTSTRPRPDRDPVPAGLLLVDKPEGPTSHDVVGRARFVLGTKKVGHAGTLDPMATGLLVLGVERGTKLLGHLALKDKTYLAVIRLGRTTSTEDAQGAELAATDASGLTDEAIAVAMAALTGDIMQRPSAVSAIKVDGVRAYARVRAGEDVELPPRPVTVSAFDLLHTDREVEIQGPAVVDLRVRVDCSTGTYIRALARDLGEALGVGAHLTALRRTRIGPFQVGDAVDIYQPEGWAPPVPAAQTPAEERPRTRRIDRPARPKVPAEVRDRVLDRIRPARSLAGTAFAVHHIDAAAAADITHGRRVPAAGQSGTYALVDEADRFLGLAQDQGGRTKPVLVWGDVD